jgi:hypothetical protein
VHRHLSQRRCGDDYFKSYAFSYNGTFCGMVADTVIGSDGLDTAKVDKPGSVSTVGRVTRLTKLP